jgi:hypothetical protein
MEYVQAGTPALKMVLANAGQCTLDPAVEALTWNTSAAGGEKGRL